MAGRVEVGVVPSYPVMVGGGIDLVKELSGVLQPGVAAILTDSNVGPLHAENMAGDLREGGWRIAEVVEVAAGEEAKSLSAYEDVLRRVARSGLPRDGTVFALGGGVVGDLGGFVAGTYMRGVNFVALPTSLLAMVDSSVGGKVGLDLPEGKNLVGGFVRPRLVCVDLDWLHTLPGREIPHGLAEVVKMGLLAGGEFYEDLSLLGGARAGDGKALETLVTHSVRFKAGVVAEDELEAGRRAILNYGHTIGHGIEAAAGYGLPHGRAISAGMVAAARLSARKFGEDLVPLHENLLQSAGLPTKLPGMDAEEILAAMHKDKKRRHNEHRFVLLEDIGRPIWDVPVSEKEIREVIAGISE